MVLPKSSTTDSKLRQTQSPSGPFNGDSSYHNQKLSPSCLVHKNHNTPKTNPLLKLYLRNQPIKVETQATFLGVIFDEHMTFKAHIEKLQTKCTKLLNLMRCISGPNLGQINKLY
jgi:hypothetical protein